MKQRVAIVQRDIAWNDVDRNLEHLETMLQGVEADVVVLSEMFQTGFITNPRGSEDDGRTLRWMERMAQRLDAAMVGSWTVKVGDEYRNRMHFVRPTGEVDYYDKWHPECERHGKSSVARIEDIELKLEDLE